MDTGHKTPEGVRVLILGTGIAGLSAALRFAGRARVTLVSKDCPEEGATRYAQGGIASVWDKADSFEAHISDTLKSGDGLCREDAVRICVEEGPRRVQDLIDWGVAFTRRSQSPTEYDLHREGGHGRRRILHADDLTGQEIIRALLAQVKAHPNIELLEHHIAVDLITEAKVMRKSRKPGACLGAYVLDIQTGQVRTLGADLTLLATGGSGKLYQYTSNPDTATGDGVAMAYRAGARVANLEFVQFHPTCLYHPQAKTFLLSEALRGEGAVLKNLSGVEIPGSLGTRDRVARAIDMEIKKTGDRHVSLDATPIGEERLKRKFPNIYDFCGQYGIDITRDPIPVVPAAHYSCGGVLVDLHGRTNIENLFAVGEVACTGVHGANRLASNSLLEGVVFASRIYDYAVENWSEIENRNSPELPLPHWDPGYAVEIEEKIDIAANWSEIRTLMWNYVGIVRSDRRLARAKRRVEVLKAEVNEYYWDFLLTRDLIELRNLLTLADLTIQCAMLRKESRGLHYTVDYPQRSDRFFGHDTIL